MHLISTLSLWAEHTSSEVWREEDPYFWGGKKVAPPLEAPLMEVPPQILILKSEPLQGGVLFGGLKTMNPRQEVNLVVIHIYFFALH
jgi:hypothetical protein